MNLLEILPQPRSIPLAGRLWKVSPLRIMDLARIQSWLQEVVPHPLEDHRDRILDAQGRERKKAIMRCQRQIATANYPPVYPSAFSRLILANEQGGRFYFGYLLGRDQAVTDADLDHIVACITDEERDRLDDLLWGGSSQWELVLNPPRIIKGGKPIDWCETFVKLSERYHMTPEQIGHLTVDQFNTLRFGHGRKVVQGVDWTHLSPEQRQAEWDEARAIRAELDAEEEHGEV